MPKQTENLLATDLELKSARSKLARTDYRIKGAPGLQFRVTSGGTKTWALAYKSPVTGQWTKAALGRYPEVGLAVAKGLAVDMAADVRKGRDPIHDKREAAAAETFASLAKRYMNEHVQRNARGETPSRSTAEAQRQLDQSILPSLGRMRVETVKRQHVMQVVETVAERGAFVAADRALGLIRAIYNWGCGTGRIDCNPTLGLKKRNTGRPKTRVLSADEIHAFWELTETLTSISAPLRLALRLQLVTGVRIGEALGAPRTEINLESGLWKIAAARTKGEREHELPLSSLARDIVAEAIRLGDEAEARRAARAGRAPQPVAWVFPAAKGGHVVDPHAASRAMIREREAFSAAEIATFNTHDLRRTVATQLGEMGTPDEIIERILNHAPRTVAGKHYNHAKYLGPMREALDAWAERLGRLTARSAASVNAAAPPLTPGGQTLVEAG
jgi:integrase